ncbi:MAG TPA: hypothetical protein VGC58_01340 [Candidatus Paceibacterota bacterium]
MRLFCIALIPALLGSGGASYLSGKHATGLATMIAWSFFMIVILHAASPRNRP